MSQCVPNWDIAETPMDARPDSRSYQGLAVNNDDAMLDYEIAELTWENGQLGMHGFGPPRFQMKHSYPNGTLESIVNQGTAKTDTDTDTDYVPWYAVSAAEAPPIMDALVPSSNPLHNHTVPPPPPPHVESDGREGSSKGSVPTYGMNSNQVTCDTGFTPATSHDSPEENLNDHDSVCHDGTPQREPAVEKTRKKGKLKSSTISIKKSRAAAIHNQSERKRRDKINQRMKTLQKLVPNSNKTDKASMLDEVIEYLKQLQAQVHLTNRLNIPSMNMMLPMTMQQQQQFPMTSFMAPMGFGMGMSMGMGLGMDHLNMVPTRPGLNAAISPLLHPSAFMPITPWDGATCDQLQASSAAAAMMVDPLSTFLACQSQPMTMEMYNRMAALFQHRASAGNSKN